MTPAVQPEQAVVKRKKSVGCAQMEVDGPAIPVDLSEKSLVTAIVNLLEQNGTLSLTELGAILGNVLGPETSQVVKKEHKGLKHLMEKHKDLFELLGKIPTMQVRLKKLPTSKSNSEKISLPPTGLASRSSSNVITSSGGKESSTTLAQYLAEFKALLTKKSWKQIAKMLRVQHNPISASLSSQVSLNGKDEMTLDTKSQKLIQNQLHELEYIDWAQLCSFHLLTCFHYFNSHYKAAVLNQIEATKCFDLFWRQNGPSLDHNAKIMTIWRRLLSEARQIATWADMSLESSGQESNMLLGLQNHLRPLAKPLEKTPALLLLQNTILRIYSHVRLFFDNTWLRKKMHGTLN